MNVVFLAPDIHSLPTGGNIYNRRVLENLEEAAHVELWPVDRAPENPGSVPEADVVVVDSLLFKHGSALHALRQAQPEAALIALVHYLACIDPTQSAASAAQREHETLARFDGAVTTSRYVRRALAGAGMDRAAIAVVPPGLDAAFREEGEAEAPRAEDEPVRLLTVANVLPGKGLRHLLGVLETMTDARWRWTLVGNESLDEAFAASFRERANGSPVADRIRLVGSVPEKEMRRVYDAHDVCVVPSRFETCSMSTREAMARGLAVVATAVGGLPENFGPPGAREEAGCLVDPDDPQALAGALRTVITDAAARRRLGTAARRRSTTFPSWPETARAFRTALADGRRV
jgi:hypothetical protein